jgi:ubiquinone/menaquinone biosynthesis C-methylase UbiE
MEVSKQPRLYTDLAEWWPLFTPPSHYVEEATDLLPTLLSATDLPPRTLLELGSGGGSLASHFKQRLRLTLTDRSAQMLEISRSVNPECEHILGDMRSRISDDNSISCSSTTRSCTRSTEHRCARR